MRTRSVRGRRQRPPRVRLPARRRRRDQRRADLSRQPLPELVGRVIVGDYVGGRVDAVARKEGPPDVLQVGETGLGLVAIAADARNELLITDGRAVYTLERRPVGASLPSRLSETGCLDVTNPTEAPAGFLPYRIGMPLWSEQGTEKARWLALPKDTAMRVKEDDSLDVPVGAVAVKSFFWQGRPIETRLFAHHSDGEWAGYSYAWRDDGTDADLLEYGGTKELGDRRGPSPPTRSANPVIRSPRATRLASSWGS